MYFSGENATVGLTYFPLAVQKKLFVFLAVLSVFGFALGYTPSWWHNKASLNVLKNEYINIYLNISTTYFTYIHTNGLSDTLRHVLLDNIKKYNFKIKPLLFNETIGCNKSDMIYELIALFISYTLGNNLSKNTR